MFIMYNFNNKLTIVYVYRFWRALFVTHFFLTTKHQPQLQTLPPDTSRSLGCWLKELYIPARIPWDQETADLSGMYRNDRNRLEKK